MVFKRPILAAAFQSAKQANGGLSSLVQLLSGLENFEPVLLTQAPTHLTERWQASGKELLVWPVADPFTQGGKKAWPKRLLSILESNRRIYSLLKSEEIAVVHCNDLLALYHVGAGARLAGAKIVLNIRDTLGVNGPRWAAAARWVDHVVVLSRDMQMRFEQELQWPDWVPVRQPQISAIYSIIDFARMNAPTPEERRRLREALGVSQGEFAIGVVGALVPKKQQLELLQALNQRRDLPENLKFYFVGDFEPGRDDYARRCQQEASAGPQAAKIVFTGYTSEVAKWYQSLDCTVCCSAHEGLARAMIESLACGTAMVSFDVASAREILEEHACGVVVGQGDFDALISAVLTAANDRSGWSQKGVRGSEVARELFDARTVVAAYEAVYAKLLGDAASEQAPEGPGRRDALRAMTSSAIHRSSAKQAGDQVSRTASENLESSG